MSVQPFQLREVGKTGLKQAGGVLFEDPSPAFNGREWRETLRQMAEGDPVIGAMLAAITMRIRDAEYRLIPANGSRRAQMIAEHFQSCFDDLDQDFDQVLGEILSFVTYGWSIFEWVMKERRGPDPPRRRGPGGGRKPPPSKFSDGKIGWHRFAPRHQDTLYRWEFDGEGNLTGFVQMAPPTYQQVAIPIGKCLHFRALHAKNNPEGRALLKNAWRPWYFKRNMENIEAIGIERDLNGYPIIEVPTAMLRDDADDDVKAVVADLLDLLQNIKRDRLEGALIPQERDDKGNKLIEFRLVSSGSQRSFDTDRIISRYDQRISMSLLADMILLGHEKVGSYALSSTKDQLFTSFLNALLGVIAGVFNRQAFPPLMAANNWPPELAPTMEFLRIKDVAIQLFADAVSKLTVAGMQFYPSRANEDHTYGVLGMAPPPDGDRPDSPGPQAAPPPGSQGSSAAPSDQGSGGGGAQPPGTGPTGPEDNPQDLLSPPEDASGGAA